MVHSGASERLRIWKILTGKDALLWKETEKTVYKKGDECLYVPIDC